MGYVLENFGETRRMGRAPDYGCGRNLRRLLLLRAIFAKRDRALVESTTGTGTRGTWGATEKGGARGQERERERPRQSVEDSAGERGRRDGWTVRGKMVRERRKRKGGRGRVKRYKTWEEERRGWPMRKRVRGDWGGRG